MSSKVIYIYKLFHKNYLKYPKFYIGSTCNVVKRQNDHKFNLSNKNSRKYNYKIYRYIRKYGGFENFQIFVLNVHEYKSNSETRKLEQRYIDLFKPQLNKNRAQAKEKKNIKKINIKKKKYKKNDNSDDTLSE